MMLQFNKSESTLRNEQDIVIKNLQIIVNAATVQVVVDTIRALPDNWYSNCTLLLYKCSAY